MEWLLLVLVCAGLFAVGYALPKWWLPVFPLLLALAVYIRAQTIDGTDSDGVPLRGWEELGAFLILLAAAPVALGVIARTSRR